MSVERAASLLAGAAFAVALSGCAAVRIGAPGDESPLTGLTRNLQPAAMRPAWRRVLADAPGRKARRESAGVAYDRSGDRVFVGAARGWFYAFRASDGKELWRSKLAASATGRAIYDRGRVLVGTDDGRLVALDAEDGEQLWHYRVKGAVTRRPVVSGKLIYFVDGTNAIYALERSSGKWVWQYRRESPANFALVGEARPVVSDGRVHVGFSDGVLVTLSAEDGVVIWIKDLAPEHDRFQDADASPVVHDGAVYAASAAGGIYALDAKTGTIRWIVKTTGVNHLIDAGDGDLVVGEDHGKISRIQMSDGRTRWSAHLGGGVPGEPVKVASYFAIASAQGGLHLLDAKTGRPIQRFVPGNGIFAPITAGRDGSIFLLSNGGVLYALRPAA